MSGQKNGLVLCIEDEDVILETYENILIGAGYTPVLCNKADEALALIEKHASSLLLVISDLRMPHLEGTSIRAAMLSKYQDIPFFIVSGYVTQELALKCIDLKISAFVHKPVAPGNLLELIERDTKLRAQSLLEKMLLEKTFIEEARALLEDVEPLIMSLETNPNNTDCINSIFRLIHTVKGSSGVLEKPALTRFAHSFEDLISKLKSGSLHASKDIVDKLLFGQDILKDMVSTFASKIDKDYDVDSLVLQLAVSTNATTKTVSDKPNSPIQTGAAQSPKDSLQVPIVMLDDVMSLGGEITVIRNMVNKLVRSIEKANPGNRDVALLTELLDEMHKINSAIQTKIVDLRKVPIKSIFRALPRTIRDLANTLDKDINLQIEGDGLRIDTTLAQALANSIVHLVRNSADHGLETRDERQRAGKNVQGKVLISCREDRETVAIHISDDGRGLDLERIKQKALEQQMYSTDELSSMSKQRLMTLIFESGFTTAAKVTDVSGRGVGMDMVRSSILAVGGKIDIESEAKRGTTFRLQLPIPRSVLIIDSLLVEVSGHTLAIPQDSIVRLLMLEGSELDEQISTVEGTGVPALILRTNDGVVPIVDLVDVLGLKRSPPGSAATSSELNLLIVKSGHTNLALRVDQILDSEEIVVKPLHKSIESLGIYGGATFMGDGRIGLILNIDGLIRLLKIPPGGHDLHKNSHAALKKVLTTEYLLIDLNANGHYALRLSDVFRLEEINSDAFSDIGEQKTLVYRGQVISVFDLRQELQLPVRNAHENAPAKTSMIVIDMNGRPIGLTVHGIHDVKSSSQPISKDVLNKLGYEGTIIMDGISLAIVAPLQILASCGVAVPTKVSVSSETAPGPSVVPIIPHQADAQDAKNQMDNAQGFGFFD